MSLCGVKIVGVGHYAPARVVTNHDLEAWLDTTDEWITTRTGMKRRHWTSDNEATSDLPPAELTAATPAGTAESAKPERQARHHRRRGPDQRFERPRREGQRPPHVARHERQERREKAPDPNSPFAKLAALKAQLEEEAKERR